ncbi:hypothetical protein GUJ93_ZPchr0003g17559 [Zizania palustris]|uniref:Gnk2-homologous domain-containing protein n=1 Tax=Zizania palustris TaxID=103762 RepID=A0A8J5S3K5_ZIZPA|nr:hypothetical protein GUJ93_ZPchr0003g17559 [Zizania palustris]
MAMESIGSYCAGTSYAFNNEASASISTLSYDLAVQCSTAGGFVTSSVGKGKNVFYGLAQCRGDVSAGDCKSCLGIAVKHLASDCNFLADARIWYDYCSMRYRKADFVGQLDTDAGVILVSVVTMDNPKKFQEAVRKAMGKAMAQVAEAFPDGMGRVKVKYTPSVNIYGLAECSPDLESAACAQCLSTAVSRFNETCGAAQGCQINYSSCRVRYEIHPFFFSLDGGRAFTDLTKYTKVVVHR